VSYLSVKKLIELPGTLGESRRKSRFVKPDAVSKSRFGNEKIREKRRQPSLRTRGGNIGREKLFESGKKG